MAKVFHVAVPLLPLFLLPPVPPMVGGALASLPGRIADREYPHDRARSRKMGSKVGRQADMIPADNSMAVQPTVGANVYVGSEFEYVKSTLVRNADAKTTLSKGVMISRLPLEPEPYKKVDDLQESKAECQCQTNLLRPSQLQRPDLWHRHDQNEKVGQNGRGGIRDPSSNLVDAVAGELRRPKLLHRHADEYEQEGDTDDPGPDEGTHHPGHLLKIGMAEDAIVHQQEAEFGPAQVPSIQNLSHDQPFGHHDYLRGINLVCMNAHAA